MNNLDLVATEDGRFFVNGYEVCEETFEMLEEDIAIAEFESGAEIDDEICPLCQDINDIMEIVLETEEYDKAFDLLSDKLIEIVSDAYEEGRQDALDDVMDYCAVKVDEE